MPLPKACWFTNNRSSRGVEKPAGFCRHTRIAMGLEPRGDQPVLYTICGGCRATLCIECLEKMADLALQYAERVVWVMAGVELDRRR